jgi:hypothetical protein
MQRVEIRTCFDDLRITPTAEMTSLPPWFPPSVAVAPAALVPASAAVVVVRAADGRVSSDFGFQLPPSVCFANAPKTSGIQMFGTEARPRQPRGSAPPRRSSGSVQGTAGSPGPA